jgi:hypothetical protein
MRRRTDTFKLAIAGSQGRPARLPLFDLIRCLRLLHRCERENRYFQCESCGEVQKWQFLLCTDELNRPVWKVTID